MANQDVQVLISEFDEALDESIASSRLKVLVLGPNMRSKEPAGVLRRHIHKEARAFGVSVLGEITGLINASKRRLGAGHNLCDYESFLVEKMDAVVIIPASPGSYAELGLFSLVDDVCSKSLVLFKKGPSSRRSFLNLGTRRAYRNRGATIRNVDYADVDEAWKEVRQFLEVRRVLAFAQRRSLTRTRR